MGATHDQFLPSGFSIDPNKAAGNAHSGHNVVFGTLNGNDVAVKPFTSIDGNTLKAKQNKALHEERMYKIVAKLGYLTINPVGVINEGNTAFLITHYMPNLVPGTSFDMAKPLDDRTKGKSPAEVASSITGILGEMHDDEVTHGDAKLRNFAFHRVTGQGPYVIDLEGAQQHQSTHVRGAEYFANSVRNDIRSIAYNLGQNGLGAHANEQDRKAVFSDVIIQPYHNALSNPSILTPSLIELAGASYGMGVTKYHRTDHHYT